jgi:integrase/recombinase XerD
MLMSAVDRYLALRRALGYTLTSAGPLLQSFARYAAARGETHICRSTAQDWAAVARTPRQRGKRLRILRGLACFLHAEDPRHELPPEPLVCLNPPRPLPYLFSLDTIQRLVHGAGQLPPRRSLRPHTFQTLFGLLAVTGLRVSEALALRLTDLTSDGLLIRETKFHKSRLVPLHATTAAALAAYLKQRLRVRTADDHLFVSLRRTPLCYATVFRMFRHLCADLQLPRSPEGRRPRLHDLRHAVAVRMLEACPQVRAQVTPHVLAASTYLGHASLRSTYWYLQASPQLLEDIAGVSEAWMKGGPTR